MFNAGDLKCDATVYGVGINDSNYVTHRTKPNGDKWICPFYKLWESLIKRCYSAKFKKQHPTYEACTIEPAWLRFSVFKVWMQTQEWQYKALDKDIIKKGNKHYSALLCCFVSQELNNIISNGGSKQEAQNRCIRKLLNRKSYQVELKVKGRPLFLGAFQLEKQAIFIYNIAKSYIFLHYAKQQKDKRVKKGLLVYAKRARDYARKAGQGAWWFPRLGDDALRRIKLRLS